MKIPDIFDTCMKEITNEKLIRKLTFFLIDQGFNFANVIVFNELQLKRMWAYISLYKPNLYLGPDAVLAK